MSLCTVSGAPQTSALRSINAMVGLGHFIRRKDPADARRVFIHPSDGLVAAIERYLSDFGCRIDALANPEPRSNGS
jgi:DNA-binding MarR family transcriptional regulator